MHNMTLSTIRKLSRTLLRYSTRLQTILYQSRNKSFFLSINIYIIIIIKRKARSNTSETFEFLESGDLRSEIIFG